MSIGEPQRRVQRPTIRLSPVSIELLRARVRLAERLASIRPTPEERARRALVDSARRALREAEQVHAARIRAAERELRRAEHAHAASVRSARSELREAERAEELAITAAEQRLAVLTASRELGRYGPLRLYEDRIETGQERVAIEPGLRALVVPGSVLVRRRPEATVRERVFNPGSRARRRPTLDSKSMYIAIEATESRVVVEARDEAGARELARAVNVAALNADRVGLGRAEARAALERELGRLRQERTLAVKEATTRFEATETDRAAVEAAAHALAAAEADTAEVLRCRDVLASLTGPRDQKVLIARLSSRAWSARARRLPTRIRRSLRLPRP